MVKRVSYQTMKKHEKFKWLFFNDRSHSEKPHANWFQIHEILEKTKLESKKKKRKKEINANQGLGGKEE